MKDVLTGEEWDVRAKVVINATGTLVHVHLIIYVYCMQCSSTPLLPITCMLVGFALSGNTYISCSL